MEWQTRRTLVHVFVLTLLPGAQTAHGVQGSGRYPHWANCKLGWLFVNGDRERN